MNSGTLGKVLVGLVAIGILMSTVFIARAAYQRGLGPALAPIPPTVPAVSGAVIVAAEPTATIAPVAPTATAVNAAVCGETTAWNLLVLGVDTVTLRGDKGSDLTRFMRLDFPNRRVTIYALSRDLWVNTSGLGLTNPTVDATELGTVFYEALRRSRQPLRRDAMVDAVNFTNRMLAWNFSLLSDHYLTVDVTQAPAMIDAIGGVPVNIPERTTDPWIGMVIQPGQQTLTGAQAVAYARAIPDSDLARINRQQLLLEALRQRLLDPSVWPRIPQLYAQFSQSVVTDLSPEQINHIACLLNEVPPASIIQDSIPQAWTTPGPQGSVAWDKAAVMNRLKELGLIP